MKTIYNFLMVAICISATSCLKQADGGGQSSNDQLKNFDWKTTKEVPVNIVAENNEVTPVLIYNGTELVAAGYTPFNEVITAPKSCTELMATSAPLPISYYLTEGRSAGRAHNNSNGIVTFKAGDARQLKVKLPDEGHKYLYKEWEQTHKGGHSYVAYFVPWWNDSPSGGRTLYEITLFADQAPEYDNNGELVNIPHTCKTADCTYYDGAGQDGDDSEHMTFDTKGTYIFEDLFPSFGDYDMNDFVVVESRTTDIWPNNKVKSVQIEYTVNAAGSSKAIAMAFRFFGVKQHDVETVTMQILDENGQATSYDCTNSSGLFSLNSNKTEASSNNSEVVIPIFENFFDLIPQSAKGYGFNTLNTPVGGKGKPITFIINVKFDKKSRNIKLSEFGTDLFIMPRSVDESNAALQRGTEIHIPDVGYTSKMNTALFNTNDDASELPNKSFRASNGYVWAIYFPFSLFDYPLESVKLDDAYPRFKKWIETSGEDIIYLDWFKYGEAGKTWETSKQ